MATTCDSSGYLFFDLSSNDLPSLRASLLASRATSHPNLTGTILLCSEGVNVRLSGSSHDVSKFKQILHSTCGFQDDQVAYKDVLGVVSDVALQAQQQTISNLPRFLVKIKKELISMGLKSADPSKSKSPATHLSPSELNDWIKSNKEFVFLDTRNDYEVKLGTFEKAVDFNIETFRDFPNAVKENLRKLPAPLTSTTTSPPPIVMFCTGGIRCEKAAFAMEEAGFSASQLFQLDGGILNYLQQSSTSDRELAYKGGCFVFDDRVCVDTNLECNNSKVCFRCKWPMSVEEIEMKIEAIGSDTFACLKCGFDDFLNAEGKKRSRKRKGNVEKSSAETAAAVPSLGIDS
jgi:UPF0176 protein